MAPEASHVPFHLIERSVDHAWPPVRSARDWKQIVTEKLLGLEAFCYPISSSEGNSFHM